jgi:hypothetical protein
MLQGAKQCFVFVALHLLSLLEIEAVRIRT